MYFFVNIYLLKQKYKFINEEFYKINPTTLKSTVSWYEYGE